VQLQLGNHSKVDKNFTGDTTCWCRFYQLTRLCWAGKVVQVDTLLLILKLHATIGFASAWLTEYNPGFGFSILLQFSARQNAIDQWWLFVAFVLSSTSVQGRRNAIAAVAKPSTL